MRQAFDEVLVFCPEVRTGGPEALHQLAHAIGRHGGRARMVYYGEASSLSLEGDRLRCRGEASPMLRDFAQYQPRPLREARLGPGTLLVFPEPMSELAGVGGVPYARALWWLSRDGALSLNPRLREADHRARLFAGPDLVHFHQSDFARRMLEANGARPCFPLSDYTDPQFVLRSQVAAANPPVAARPNRIAHFPTKGAALAERFLARPVPSRAPAEVVAIRGMPKARVCDTLFGARLYIDFGHHPGKDRVPREAAIAGAVVLLHAEGAAACFADHPLPAEHLFTAADIDSGALHAKAAAILDDPAPHAEAQRAYRQAILLERERFDLEVRSFFFTGA